jgi:hypothetical protein
MGISETIRGIREERVNNKYRSREPVLKSNAVKEAAKNLEEIKLKPQAIFLEWQQYVFPLFPRTNKIIDESMKISAALEIGKSDENTQVLRGRLGEKWGKKLVSHLRDDLEKRVSSTDYCGGLNTNAGRLIVSLSQALGIRPSDEALATHVQGVSEWYLYRIKTLQNDFDKAQVALDQANAMPADTDEMRNAHCEWESAYSREMDEDDWSEEDDDQLGRLIRGEK